MLTDVVRASQPGEDRNVRTVLEDAESLEGRPKDVHPSPQRTLQLVGQVHRVGSGNDSEERYGIGRSRKVEQTARQIQQEKDRGIMFVCNVNASIEKQ